MKDLFLTVVEISISTSFIILIMLIFSSYLNRRYAVKWKYLIWIVIAARLIIPLNFRVPAQKIVIDIPTQITTPINVNIENEPTLILQDTPDLTPISLLDVAACLWLGGCLLFLSVHILSFLHFRNRIIQDADEVNDEKILHHICRISEDLRIKSKIPVVRYPDAGSPMMIGFFKPVLVLPDCEYDEDELVFILKHELIHFKRRDIYFKLLFVAANGVHWFNPLVYILQKEAVIDMELSCDERVIQQTPYAVRRAYTETLFSTLSRQHKKGTALTTQFYGGKKIMEKRFQNILIKSKKRNGIMVSIFAACLTLVSGMFVGCSVAGNISSIVQSHAHKPLQVSNDEENILTTGKEILNLFFVSEAERQFFNNMASELDLSEDQIEKIKVLSLQQVKDNKTVYMEYTDPEIFNQKVQEIAYNTDNQLKQILGEKYIPFCDGVNQWWNNGRNVVLPVDSEQIKNVVEEFAAAYFSKDINALESLLPDSYAWDITAYEGTGTISDITLKGLPNAENMAVGSILTVSMQYRDSTHADMFQYLTFELIKQDTSWQIQFYGAEG